MVLTELFTCRYYGKDFADETRWMSMERKREIPDLGRRRAGVMKRDKIRYF